MGMIIQMHELSVIIISMAVYPYGRPVYHSLLQNTVLYTVFIDNMLVCVHSLNEVCCSHMSQLFESGFFFLNIERRLTYMTL